MLQIMISVRQFCQTYSIGRTKAYELIAQNRIETVKLGRKRLITVSSANRLIEQLSTTEGR